MIRDRRAVDQERSPVIFGSPDYPITMKNVSRFTRNGILNLLGWVVPILAQVATMPTIIRTVGTQGFGLLTIATSFIGYYTVFELGLGQSLTKIVSQYLPLKNYSVINSSISQALLIQLLIGLVGAGILVCFNQPLTKLFINESDPQFYIAKRLFLVVGFGIPATMVINPMQCVLAGMQRFDLQSSISGIFGIARSRCSMRSEPASAASPVPPCWARSSTPARATGFSPAISWDRG